MTKKKETAPRVLMSKHTNSLLRVVQRPSIGVNLEWGPNDSKCRPICHMRWTDGLRPEVEKRVMADAHRLVDCWNALKGMNPEAVKDALWAFSEIMKELPTNRDWLNPDLEKIAFAALARLEAIERAKVGLRPKK